MPDSPKTSRATNRSQFSPSQAKGRAGEDLALSFLARQGLEMVERNFRCRGGEIDLIMRQEQEIVFVEVRVRSKGKFGGAAASITVHKQARLVLAAQTFLQRFRDLPACRFDVIAIDSGNVTWLKNVIES